MFHVFRSDDLPDLDEHAKSPLQEFSNEVQRLWDLKHSEVAQEEQVEGMEEEEDTPTSSSACCGRDCSKVALALVSTLPQLFDKISDVDMKVQAVCNRLNLFIDDQQGGKEVANDGGKGQRFG